MIVFDIETGPLPDEQLRALCPEFIPVRVCGWIRVKLLA